MLVVVYTRTCFTKWANSRPQTRWLGYYKNIIPGAATLHDEEALRLTGVSKLL